MLGRQNRESGFTLIELMITIAILAIVLSAAFPSYRTFVANAQIRITAESIRNGLQLARAEAIKRNANVKFTIASAANDSSWSVGCVTVVADLDGDGVADCPATIQSKTVREGSGSTLSLTKVGSNTLTFINLGTTNSTAGQLTRVNIDNTSIPAAISKELSVSIQTGGNARVCDPNAATTDPKYC